MARYSNLISADLANTLMKSNMWEESLQFQVIVHDSGEVKTGTQALDTSHP